MPRRFLHTHTYELVKESDMGLYMKWYYNQQVNGTPKDQNSKHSYSYAILSHTWLENNEKTASKEVTALDMKTSFSNLKLGRLKKAGWRKVEEFCKLARSEGFQWAWMDTCCIDKRSTSETQEAINAMFRWYRDAAICYAYLQDVNAPETLLPIDWGYNDQHTHCDEFRKSKWFSRSWTLQELLAPHDLMFVDTNWTPIGTRDQWAEGIQKASGIEPRYLTQFEDCSIAQKLSWAAERDATMPEDRAYSLLGLFGISLPLSYGEGSMAFIRFQHELLRTHDDDSLLSWQDDVEEKRLSNPEGILAPSVSCFKEGKHVQKPESGRPKNIMFSMTNRGLQMSRATIHKSSESPVCIVELDCFRKPSGPEEKEQRCRLHLKKSHGEDQNCYERLTAKERTEYKVSELEDQQHSAKWFDPRGRGPDPFVILQPNGDPSYHAAHEVRVYFHSDTEQKENCQDEDEEHAFKTMIEPETESFTDSFGERYLSLRGSKDGNNAQPHYAKLRISRATNKPLYCVQLQLNASIEVCCKVVKDNPGNRSHGFENATSMVEVESAHLLVRAIPEPIRSKLTSDWIEGQQKAATSNEESSEEGLGHSDIGSRKGRSYRLSATVWPAT